MRVLGCKSEIKHINIQLSVDRCGILLHNIPVDFKKGLNWQVAVIRFFDLFVRMAGSSHLSGNF